jgi:TatD DNase family protein
VLVDTHCHLDSQYCPGGAGEVIARAEAVGVVGFVVIGVGRDLSHADEAVALAKAMPQKVAATVGIHPHDAKLMDQAALERLAREPEVVAVGETGLDFHYDYAPREVQREAFRNQVQLARKLQKPLIIHTRTAPEETLAILREESARDVGGIIHCFSEDRAFAAQALDLGFDISFSGIVTFKTATAIHDVAAWAPLDRILVETDSPYLAPVPYRGKPCEPAFVVHTAKRVADLRGTTLEAISEHTTRNAERRFRRKFPSA